MYQFVNVHHLFLVQLRINKNAIFRFSPCFCYYCFCYRMRMCPRVAQRCVFTTMNSFSLSQPTWHCMYLRSLAFLWSKMPTFQWAGMREGGEPLPLNFQYLTLIIWTLWFQFGHDIFTGFKTLKLRCLFSDIQWETPYIYLQQSLSFNFDRS